MKPIYEIEMPVYTDSELHRTLTEWANMRDPSTKGTGSSQIDLKDGRSFVLSNAAPVKLSESGNICRWLLYCSD